MALSILQVVVCLGGLESDESEFLCVCVVFFGHQYLQIGILEMCNLDNESLILGLL